MGVTDCLPQMKAGNILKDATIAAYVGNAPLVIGVDGSILVHMVINDSSEDILIRDDWTSFMVAIKEQIDFLKMACPKSRFIIVLDGHRIGAKLANASRGASREEAKRIVDEKWANDEMPTKKELDAAVCVNVIKAAEIVYQCRKALGVEVKVAPGEAEHQLVWLRQTGRVTHVMCNDSDYIVLGGDNLILVHQTLRSTVHIFVRSVFKTLTMVANSAARDKVRSERGRRNKTSVKRFSDAFFALLCGSVDLAMSTLLVYSSITGTDYGGVEGVGTIEAQKSILMAYDPEKGRLDLEAIVSMCENKSRDKDNVRRTMCNSLVMYWSGIIFDESCSEVKAMRPMNNAMAAFVATTHTCVPEFTGLTNFEGVDGNSYYHAFGYDIRNLSKRDEELPDVIISKWLQTEEKPAGVIHTPNIKWWSLKLLKAFITHRRPDTSFQGLKKKDLFELVTEIHAAEPFRLELEHLLDKEIRSVLSVEHIRQILTQHLRTDASTHNDVTDQEAMKSRLHRAALAHSHRANPRLYDDVESLLQHRILMEKPYNDKWVEESGWVEVTNETKLDMDVGNVCKWWRVNGGDTSRQKRIAAYRALRGMNIKRVPIEGTDSSGTSPHHVWLRAYVMRFNQANERRVCAKLLMVSGRVVKVCGMRCLRPLPNKKGNVVDPSPCRNHNGSCVHCAVFHRYMLAMRPGSTDGECQWNHGTAIHVVKTAKAVSRFGKKGMARTDALRDQIIGMVDWPNIKRAMTRAQTQRYTRRGRRVKCSFD